MLKERTDLRNIAIIAHVDHGKTTLVDSMLKQARVFRANQQVVERVLDSNELERERGITILSKNTAITIPHPSSQGEAKINIVDTPGHADFGGEVERVLNMVDGVLLLVDAAEGPMPQTRFVLKKALALGHKAVVVVNKVDRKHADPERVLNQTFDLFIDLGAADDQADFAVVYTNALDGKAGLSPELGPDLQALFAAILQHIPAPNVDADAPLQLLVTTLGYDQYRGMTAIGRIHAGTLKVGQTVARLRLDGEALPERARYIYLFQGLELVSVDDAEAGDIVSIGGLEDVSIGETLADPEYPSPLPTISVEAPTVRMTFGVNTSPFAGREARWSTSRNIRERLFNELRKNIALRVDTTDSADTFIVSGRGELHLAILVETMRREGYEFQVARPEVIYQPGPDGALLEPFEDVHIETSAETVGAVVELLGARRGQMVEVGEVADGSVSMSYIVPTRGLLGFRFHFLTATRGEGTLYTLFREYAPKAGAIRARTFGSLVARRLGTTTTYALLTAEVRGRLFVGPGVEVYQGMVIGEHQRPGDLALNVCKAKHLTSMRQSFKEIDNRLSPPRQMSLDEAIEYLADDELLEITPESYRIRKKILDTEKREKQSKRARETLQV